MNRQDAKGVVLTGYYMNSDSLQPHLGVNCVEEADPSVPSRRTGNYNVQNRSKNAAGKPPYNRCNSQDSLDMDVFWKEVESIGEADTGPQEEVQLKVADEGEHEEAWLTEAGLATLFQESDPDDSDDSKAMLSTLTRTQAAAVEKRVELLKQTMRKRNKQYHVPDVREIFKPPPGSTADSEETQQLGEDSQATERSENGKRDVASSDKAMGNGACPPADQSTLNSETDLNLEVSFAEQALSYRERSKGVESQSQSESEADDKLPNFKVPPDKTGRTKVGDLAPQDMKMVRRLALIEMTALFDMAKIDWKSNKVVKLKEKESGLFGVPLATLLEQDQRRVTGTKVPLILQRLISHIEGEGLDTEGLLRIPGVAIRVKALVQELEAKFYEGTFPWETLKQHDAASILKFFIRELPHPLLTVEYLSAFISVLKLPTNKQQLQALNLLVLLLPETSRDTLKALMEFFQRVIDHKEQNKMTLNNVAVVMAPNIFMFKGFRNKITEQQEFSMATGTASIVRLLIQYQNLLWTIPRFIINQVREQNTEKQKQKKASKEKGMKRLLKKMTHDRDKPDKQERNTSESDSSQGFIRVQAPEFSKVSMAVQLTEDLQASDILVRFVSQESPVSVKREDLCLYEIGGNIKERCLDEEAYMKALLELNPSAEWVIRPTQR
ncbi:rho GTPase-activating protein 18 isoform X2 [Clupea harengus]|uniref:Rho GTPase-activating protein 18 isoform X2 n=1 Tax=Clupea harengus TaxID=7950 RepID=A0A6P3VYN5_CLUHA|nr:rho GTPase-activating protein 18 isoform X2 [Clupea harengus]